MPSPLPSPWRPLSWSKDPLQRRFARSPNRFQIGSPSNRPPSHLTPPPNHASFGRAPDPASRPHAPYAGPPDGGSVALDPRQRRPQQPRRPPSRNRLGLCRHLWVLHHRPRADRISSPRCHRPHPAVFHPGTAPPAPDRAGRRSRSPAAQSRPSPLRFGPLSRPNTYTPDRSPRGRPLVRVCLPGPRHGGSKANCCEPLLNHKNFAPITENCL
jgi:hypothetical protein